MNQNTSRLQVVDALRGFAIISIMLLHNIEHFDFYYNPTNLPAWMPAIDKGIWNTLFFLFGGKSYAIFALLFGLTFFIQYDNREKMGFDFRGRFAWRMLLLLAFGFINSAFYEGDILSIYAVIAFLLIPVARLNTKTVLFIAIALMLQPYEWIKFFSALNNPNIKVSNPISWTYFGKAGEYLTGSSLINTWIGNLTNGKMAVLNWTWENGRVFQTLSLFMFGMLTGRKFLFAPSLANKKFWIYALITASVLFIPLFIVNSNIAAWVGNKAISNPLLIITKSWSNMALMLVWVSGFALLFQNGFFYKILNVFSWLGRMSLTNYIMQSVMGSIIYYGFGLGLYKYTGATYCLLIGIVLAILQGYFCYWWLKRHSQGPLEWIWHKATWVGAK